MKINLVRKSYGFLFAEDDDADKARKIKADTVVTADIKVFRNIKLHRKYFKLIDVAWNFLTEEQQAFFHNDKEGFRYTLEISAGYYKRIWLEGHQDWGEIPVSIAFDKMDEATFDRLYEGVVRVIFKLFGNRIDKDTFYEQLKDF